MNSEPKIPEIYTTEDNNTKIISPDVEDVITGRRYGFVQPYR